MVSASPGVFGCREGAWIFASGRRRSRCISCDGCCAGRRAAALTVGEAVWLPARRPRVLGVSLIDEGGELARVQQELSRKLSAGGWYAPETRPFFAHVTVARVRKGGRVRPVDVAPPPPLRF